MRLSVKIPLLLAGVAFGTVSSFGVISARLAADRLRRAAITSLDHSVHAYAGAMSRSLQGASGLLEITKPGPRLASELAARPKDRTAVGVPQDAFAADRARARRILHRSAAFENVMLLDARGDVVLVEPFEEQSALPGRSLADLAWVQAVIDRDASVVSDLHISPATSAPSVVIATPVRDRSGRRIGIWAGALDLARLRELALVTSPDAQVGGYGFVTDARGLIVVHQAEPNYVRYQADFAGVPPVTAALAGISGRGRWTNPIDLQVKLGAYLPLDPFGWTVVYSVDERIALASSREFANTIMLAGIGVSIATILVAMLAVSRVVRPLRSMSRAVVAIQAGDLEQRVAASSADELGSLAKALNGMATQLGANQRELLARADRLEQANRALEVSNRELDAFSYSVSHDLRAPLRAIDGFSSALVEDHGAELSDDGKEMLARVRAAAVRMGSLIDDLLMLSRLGRAPMRAEDVELSGVCEEVVAELRDAEPERSVSVWIEPNMRVHGDRNLLRIAMTNLIGNAWKFTGPIPHPRVRIGRADGARGPCFFVQDNGVGFDMATAGKLFGAFERLHPATEFPGNGIGLTTVQRIIRRHGGEIWADSAPNRGTTFSFTLGTRPVAA